MFLNRNRASSRVLGSPKIPYISIQFRARYFARVSSFPNLLSNDENEAIRFAHSVVSSSSRPIGTNGWERLRRDERCNLVPEGNGQEKESRRNTKGDKARQVLYYN